MCNGSLTANAPLFLGLGLTCQDVMWHRLSFWTCDYSQHVSLTLQPAGFWVPAWEPLPACVSTCSLPCWLKAVFKEGGMKSVLFRGGPQAKPFHSDLTSVCGLRRTNLSLERLVRMPHSPAFLFFPRFHYQLQA